ncbi:MAG TPA: efflux RND transporter periplasmic adaptor subunit [Chloroflexota bacterium]|nr:efflux RND transporter periplasmic adaptor subunit [Chloroflexota bacterium]
MIIPTKAATLLGTLLLLTACGVPADPLPGTATVQRGNLTQTASAAGTTVATSQSKLSFTIAGKLAKLDANAGDQVSAGQVLAELDTADLKSALQQAQAGQQVAEAGVAAAQAKVQQLLTSAKPQTIAQANAGADAARAKLQDMIDGGRPQQVAQAQAQLDAAKQKLQLAQNGARQEQVQQAQAALQAAQAKLQALQNGPRPEAVAILQKQIDTAKNNLYAAQVTRDALCAGVKFGQTAPTGAPVNCEGGQAAVNAAQTGVDTANEQLRLATAPPTATDLQQAQSTVDQAKAQLALLQSNTPQDVQQARDAVTQADQGVSLAKSPYTAQQIQQARDAVAQADAAAQLAAHPFTDADVSLAQAGVQQAEAQLAQAQAGVATAQTNLDSAQLKAPAAGKVLQVDVSPGEVMSNLGAPTIVMVLGLGEVVVNVSLPERASAQVKPGQDATVTFDSLPGKQFDAKVSDVSPAASTVQNLVSYVATIKLQSPGDQIRPGMNANVTIYTLRKQDVLLVPNGAIQSYQGKDIVLLLTDGQKKQTPIQVGASDQDNTEIVNGLTEGQQVALISKSLNGVTVAGAKPS